MKKFRSFSKEISFIVIVISFTGCASIMSKIDYPHPVQLTYSDGRSAVVAENEIADPNKVFSSYCQGGKQIKNLTFSFTFVSPKTPVGWPINEAGQFMKALNKSRRCLNKNAFFRLAETPDCRTYYGPYLVDLRGKSVCAVGNRNDPTWILSSTKSSSEIKSVFLNMVPKSASDSYEPVFVTSSSGDLVAGYVFNDHQDRIRELNAMFGDDVRSASIASWSSLVNNFTILEPLDFQKTTYLDEIENVQDQEDCNVDDKYPAESVTYFNNGQYETVQAFGIDEQGNTDVSAAIGQKKKIWKRYVSRFSEEKESSDTQSPHVNKVQVSVDLNTFCRYGRSVSDMISK